MTAKGVRVSPVRADGTVSVCISRTIYVFRQATAVDQDPVLVSTKALAAGFDANIRNRKALADPAKRVPDARAAAKRAFLLASDQWCMWCETAKEACRCRRQA